MYCLVSVEVGELEPSGVGGRHCLGMGRAV